MKGTDILTLLTKIKSFYAPLQPGVPIGGQEIVYTEVKPDHEIEHLVYCFWQLRTPQPLEEPFSYRVVSDGCIDIFFNNNRISESFVMGFSKNYTAFSIGTDFDYVGIRFLPAAFPTLFSIAATNLNSDSQFLYEVLPDFAKWLQASISTQSSLSYICTQMNGKLREILHSKELDVDIRFLGALHLIFQNKGYLQTENDLDTGLSPRQLRRIFNYYIGTTPKAFSNVVRFQYILNAIPLGQLSKDSRVYLEVGFFDQAHFIKDFKRFYGVTPTQAFGHIPN